MLRDLWLYGHIWQYMKWMFMSYSGVLNAGTHSYLGIKSNWQAVTLPHVPHPSSTAALCQVQQVSLSHLPWSNCPVLPAYDLHTFCNVKAKQRRKARLWLNLVDKLVWNGIARIWLYKKLFKKCNQAIFLLLSSFTCHFSCIKAKSFSPHPHSVGLLGLCLLNWSIKAFTGLKTGYELDRATF